jgi:small subunit ribosomal protein S6
MQTDRKERVYETLFITPPQLGEDDVEKLIGDVKDIFASRGAEVERIERWGRRRLAYPVKSHDEGWYVLLQVKGPGGAVQEVERRMRINENVIKYLTIRLDDVAGAVEYVTIRLQKLAQQEEERKQRAAERAAAVTRDESERARRDDDIPSLRDDDDDDSYGEDR